MQKGVTFTIKSVYKRIIPYWSSLIEYVYPNICVVCKTELGNNQNHICFNCSSELPKTYFENYTSPSPLDELFWGRIQIQNTYSFLFFEKGNACQKILHQIKYKSNKPLAIEMGRKLAYGILSDQRFESIDVLIPIPLHPKKQFQRGYNQSELLVEGVNEILKTKIDTENVIRTKANTTQTKKSRFKRYDNVENIFDMKTPGLYDGKHIALLDDAITTGSTIEACVRIIQEKNPAVRISLISFAIAK